MALSTIVNPPAAVPPPLSVRLELPVVALVPAKLVLAPVAAAKVAPAATPIAVLPRLPLLKVSCPLLMVVAPE